MQIKNEITKDTMSIIVAGDFVATDRITDIIGGGKFEYAFSEIKEIVDNTDYSLVNLESPIADELACPINKIGPHLKSTVRLLDAIKYIGFKGVTLANNHFCDYGESGALTTMSLLKDNNLDFVGAGQCLDKASEILYVPIKGKNVAIINVCEHEYSIASERTAGANPINPIKQYYEILKARKIADVVLVIVHGGIENFKYPTPRMQLIYRFFIDAGADTVINHHQHCFSGYEIYNKKPIFYGIGNFCFDKKGKRNTEWNKGYMVKLIFDNDINFEIFPYCQCDEHPVIRPITGMEKDSFFNELQSLNCIISNQKDLNLKYEQLLCSTDYQYSVNIYSNRFLNALCKRGYLPSFIPKKTLFRMLHNIICESHYDRFLHSVSKKIE